MKFSLYSKKNVLDEMQEQTMSKIERRGFWLMWGGLLAAMVIQQLTGNADKATGEGVVFTLLAAVAVTVLHGLTHGYWMGAAFTGVSTGLLCFALLQFCAHLVQKNRKKLDDEPEEK